MLQSAIHNAAPDQPAGTGPERRKVLHWRTNERMGGKIPVWEASDSAKADIADRLDAAKNPADTPQSFDKAMAYAANGQNAAPGAAEEFGFGDLLDMVNPLQQLPIIGHFYRELTGDDIKPVSKIIGGGIYGGPFGAAAGLVNTVVEYETGKDVPGNVVAMVMNGEKPAYRTERLAQGPEKQLSDTIERLEDGDPSLPGNMIGFTDLGYGKRAVYERFPAADGRTAGTMVRKREEVAAPETARTPITELTFTPLPLILREELQD